MANSGFQRERGLVLWAAAVVFVGLWVVLAYLSYLAVCDWL